jgi:hypothetical protein
MFVVKFDNGASGIVRPTRETALATAVKRRPARVYRIGSPNVLIAVVNRHGGIIEAVDDSDPSGPAADRAANEWG